MTPKNWMFHDTHLGTNVQAGRHAVAIDEIRASFTPTLWRDSADEPHPNVDQQWFPGVHSDIGGGYGVSGLSDITLKWMIDQAAELGAGRQA